MMSAIICPGALPHRQLSGRILLLVHPQLGGAGALAGLPGDKEEVTQTLL